MPLTDMLSVPIALAFTYLVLSSAASTLRELWVGFFKSRAKALKSTVFALLDGNATGGIAEAVIGHALFGGLGPGKDDPSYVPARSFTIALIDTLIGDSRAPLSTAVQTGIAQLDSNLPVKRALSALINDSGGDIERFKEAVDRWYQDAMDRLSGKYKRGSQVWMLVIGLILAVTLNVDTIRIVSTLMNNQDMSRQIADAVSANIKTMQPQAPATGEADKDPAGSEDVVAETNKVVVESLKALTGVGLPVGWQTCTPDNCPADRITVDHFVHGKLPWLSMVFGWLLTASAVSFGAPFWFDMLNRFVNLRASGPKPKDAAGKAPQDREP